MLWNILGAAAAAALVVLLIWKLRGLMLTPMRTGQGTELTVRLDVYGPDTSLEGAVAAIKWLRENGTLPCNIEIRDLGMDDATRAVARSLAGDDEYICFLMEGN